MGVGGTVGQTLHVLGLIPSKDGESFVDFWRRSDAGEHSRRELNERVLSPDERS